jgi:ADP-ribosylarginine hydrolase
MNYKNHLSKIKNEKERQLIASILIHALGDTIGFKNSQWEFGIKDSIQLSVMYKIHDFVHIGGINYVPGKNWRISDDTLLHMSIMQTFLKEKKDINKFNDELVTNFIDVYNNEFKDISIRRPGNATMKSLESLKTNTDWRDMPYNEYGGGSGASMRTPIIGFMFDDVESIIKFSIETSKITHNNVTGYLGGFCSAYFVMLAVKKVPIKEWPFKLMDVYKNKLIEKYIEKSTIDIVKYKKCRHTFFAKWNKYINDKFDLNKNIIVRRSNKNFVHRSTYYYESFGYKKTMFPGGSGDDSVIIAYDCLLDSKGKWEKLVYYSMLHAGDTDTTGCIAGALYGCFYGFGDIPRQSFDNLEKFDELIDLGKKIFNKHMV